MKIHTERCVFQTGKGIDLIDITENVHNVLQHSGISNGMVNITSAHTTTALAINEYESRLVDDVRLYLSRLVPEKDRYLHNDIHLRDCPQDEPENAHSHIMAMLLSSSESVIVEDGRLLLGQWQSILFFELDGSRERTVSIQVLGV